MFPRLLLKRANQEPPGSRLPERRQAPPLATCPISGAVCSVFSRTIVSYAQSFCRCSGRCRFLGELAALDLKTSWLLTRFGAQAELSGVVKGSPCSPSARLRWRPRLDGADSGFWPGWPWRESAFFPSVPLGKGGPRNRPFNARRRGSIQSGGGSLLAAYFCVT